MKKITFILFVFLLLGCQTNSTKLKDDITNEIVSMSKNTPIFYTTMNKTYYSYYLPKDIGRIDSNELSSLLIKDGTKMIMNFNPNSIVIHDYYHKMNAKKYEEIQVINDDLYYHAKGTYLGNDYRYHDYNLRVMKLDKTDFLLYFELGYVNFISIVKEVQIESFAHSMMVIAKSVQYDSNEIIAQFSMQSTSDSIKEDLDEFNDELPNDGSLSDLINQSKK